jgi:hypothetical protein
MGICSISKPKHPNEIREEEKNAKARKSNKNRNKIEQNQTSALLINININITLPDSSANLHHQCKSENRLFVTSCRT